MKYFHFTIDCDFIPNSDFVFNQLLTFIKDNTLKPTFFLAGKFVEMYPDLSQELAANFEIGCHGLYHGLSAKESFCDKVSYHERFRCLEEATWLIEKYTGVRPELFRAPNLRISEDTFTILRDLNYKIDSSIPSRRFDFFHGSINNLRYFDRPVKPHFLNNGLFEIPPSAFVFPLNMRFLKLFGINIFLKFFDFFFRDRSLVVFYIHPAELVADSSVLEYPKEHDSFYKKGGLYLLNELERLFANLTSNDFSSITMTQNLENQKIMDSIADFKSSSGRKFRLEAESSNY